MKIFDEIKVLELLCLSTSKWGMYISWHTDMSPEYEFPEVVKAAPYLSFPKDGQVMIYRRAYLLFDSEEEMERHFDLTVGDDGPTSLNDYNGPLKVYALTCNPQGQLCNENT